MSLARVSKKFTFECSSYECWCLLLFIGMCDALSMISLLGNIGSEWNFTLFETQKFFVLYNKFEGPQLYYWLVLIDYTQMWLGPSL